MLKFNDVAFEAAYGTAKQLPPSDLPEIVFAGKSNVGKSSLINRLFSENRNIHRKRNQNTVHSRLRTYRKANR